MAHPREHHSDSAVPLTPPSSYRHWSVSDTPSHHLANSSYFNQTPRPNLRSTTSSRHRSTSVASHPFSDAGDSQSHIPGNSQDEDFDDPGAGTPSDENDNDAPEADETDPITLKDRQSLMNVQHPFGLPIWKPALYKKSRSVTRQADAALHNVPSAQAERHISPGNIFWLVFFGWWLAAVCMLISFILYFLPDRRQRYYRLTYGLGWYIFWPFGKYVEGLGMAAKDPTGVPMEVEETEEEEGEREREGHEDHGEEDIEGVHSRTQSAVSDDADTIKPDLSPASQATDSQVHLRVPTTETTSLLPRQRSMEVPVPSRSYGATSTLEEGIKSFPSASTLGQIAFWLLFICVIAPLLLVVCLICWGLVVTVPMAKLNWRLIKHIWQHPLDIRFCAAPKSLVVELPPNIASASSTTHAQAESLPISATPSHISVKRMRLAAGQAAPGPVPNSTVLLCTYHAAGLGYYKYTLGGVNILFVNLLAAVFFVLLDGYVIMEHVEERQKHGEYVSPVLAAVGSRAVVFLLSLLSIIPLSYFIGMAVASISAQSSIGMGAVINATFGSLIEIILYGMMLVDGKGLLVEGSIVGSLEAGVLLMPGLSMVSSAMRRKEQKFNAKSAGVTSMMLIMAVIGILAPTLFYQTYGNFQLICTGCPPGGASPNQPWKCDQCFYEHPDPVQDPFYQSTVKSFMYFCAVVLLLSYLIGLWFSLRTHASQIWQNPQQAMHHQDLPPPSLASNLANRLSFYNKMKGPRRPSFAGAESTGGSQSGDTQHPPQQSTQQAARTSAPPSPTLQRHISFSQTVPPSLAASSGFAPVMESVDAAVKQQQQGMKMPENINTDAFTRAVAVATVSALRHQQAAAGKVHPRPADSHDVGGHGGHDAPNWSRTLSAGVLLGCTVLYAVIAELLVECVDVIIGESKGHEKFLGITLFALAPNTTEFMNAISFALNGNIALSMEIGSAYALQVCLLQIPAMVAFSAWYNPDQMGKVARTFTLIFPRWDVVVLILSMFLMTYTYIEAKSNYHRGSILILSYLVLVAGFYYAPQRDDEDSREAHPGEIDLNSQARMFTMTFWQALRYHLAKVW